MRIRKFNEGFKDKESKRLEEEMRKRQECVTILNLKDKAKFWKYHNKLMS